LFVKKIILLLLNIFKLNLLMNKKIIFLSILFALFGICAQSQSKDKPKSIITTAASIKTYYEKSQLEGMQKGELISLYIERIKVLINTLPYIALATKAGVTMTDIGIPDSSDNRKLLDVEHDNSAAFMGTSADFESKMLPYSDKGTLVTCILFYENILKELHVMNE
jgi:hypothetical protein